MNNPQPLASRQWFVLLFIPPYSRFKLENAIADFNKTLAAENQVELFAPTIKLAEVIDGKVVLKEKRLTYFYVFVNGTLPDVKELCSIRSNGCSLISDNVSGNQYAMVSDTAMENFKRIARFYCNSIPFFDITDIDLEEGDLVEVMDGNYAGLSGTFHPKSRSNKGNLVIAATAKLGTVIWDIDARYVRILKFSEKTRRPYEYLEKYLERLLPVMRKFHCDESLTDREKSTLAVFVQRMGKASIENRKLEAKMAATLMCTNFILGDMTQYAGCRSRYEKLRNEVTNPWTQAMIDLLLYACDNNLPRLDARYRMIAGEPGHHLSKNQRQIADEFHYYLGINSNQVV